MHGSMARWPNWQTKWGLRPAIAAAVLLLAGVLIGSTVSPPSTARAEVEPPLPPQSFQSGGQLSVPILKDIAATLHQMDARLARLETVASQLQRRSN
jgi:hypothetical protein